MSARTATGAAQRQPYTGPERLETFAVRTEDGTIVEGSTAADAMLRAASAGYDTGIQNAGFITSHGRFVLEGREAMMLAFRADQLRRNTPVYKSLSQGTIPFEVDRYRNEQKVRGVGGKNASIAAPPKPIIAGLIGEHGRVIGPIMMKWADGARAVPANPWHAARLQEQALKKGLPPDIHNPEGGPVIRSRAIRYNFGDGDGEQIEAVERFDGRGAYKHPETGMSLHVIEGYQLSDDSFITRDEALKLFAGADIGPEGRGWRKVGKS